MLAAQVTDLASGWLLGVAGRLFAANEGVQVGQGLCAVAIRRDRLVVNVVEERAAFSGKTCNVDLDLDRKTRANRRGDDGTADRNLWLVENGLVDGGRRVVQVLNGITELASGLFLGDGEDAQGGDDKGGVEHFERLATSRILVNAQ